MSHAPTKSQAAPGLEALLPLVGKWHTEGAQLESPLGPASPFVAVETFEWLDGGHFLVHRLDGRFGKQPAACIEIIGKNASGLFARTFYNDGNVNEWKLEERGRQLIMSGTWPNGARDSFQIRYTMTVTELGNTLEGKWEYSRDGQSFQTFLEARATKALPLPNTSIG
jgi:hypothetical protein